MTNSLMCLIPLSRSILDLGRTFFKQDYSILVTSFPIGGRKHFKNSLLLNAVTVQFSCDTAQQKYSK
jgi:hypothetical protein